MMTEPTAWRVRRARIRVRVTIAATAMSLLGAIAGSVVFVGVLHRNMEQALLSQADQQAATIRAQLAAGRSAAQATVSAKSDVLLQIIDANGTIAGTDHRDVVAPVRTAAGTTSGAVITPLDDRYAVVAMPAGRGRLIVVGLSEEQVERATDIAIVLLAIAVPVGGALIAAVVWFSVGRALRPVEVMRREADMITSEHLHRRLAVPLGDDEIPLLAHTLNAMLDRIDQTQRQQRQFVSDASHELRSPLAILRQVAESADRHPHATTTTELARDVLAEERRMEGLVTALLTLARLDDGETAAGQIVDLDDVVFEVVDRVRPGVEGVSFDLRGVSGGQVAGDRFLLAQAVTNLVSNAARHAASRVALTLTERAGRVELQVDDDGAGIRPADRARVFDRFTRLDEARARDSGGAGLGLAITEKVVHGVHGSIRVEEAPLGGARFVIVLPSTSGHASTAP